MNVMG